MSGRARDYGQHSRDELLELGHERGEELLGAFVCDRAVVCDQAGVSWMYASGAVI